MSDEGWRDVTPSTPGFKFEVQMHSDGRARHRPVVWCYDYSGPLKRQYPVEAGPWLPGWPGKGLQW